MAGRGYAFWGTQNFCVRLHREMFTICGGNAFAYPKKYSKPSWVRKIFCLQR
jgi:hypothetical protein